MDIRKEIRNILAEAFREGHYVERLYDRFLNQSVLTVGYEIPGTIGQYNIVGTFVLPEEIKNQILENAKLVENYKFPTNKDYGIQIGVIPVDKDKVNYFDESLKEKVKRFTLLFVDEKTQSNGNLVYAIVRQNRLVTIYFAKNYVVQDAAKLRVDAIIKNMDVIKQKKVR